MVGWGAAQMQAALTLFNHTPWLKRHAWRSGAAVVALSALGLFWLRRRLRLGDTLPRG